MATLRDLGLSEYEARVYRSLLRTGPTTAKELSHASDVPMGRIYDVLGDLESDQMVRSQNASQPKKYAPVEPETALDRLLAEKRRELEAELRGYESIVDDLASELDPAVPADEPFWTVAMGPDDSVDLLIERLGSATDRIVTVVSEPSPQLDLDEVGDRVADEIEAGLERGVEISVLISPAMVDAVSDGLRFRYERLLSDYPDFEVRLAEDISGTFNLIDRTEVCIEVPNPLAPDEAFALLALTDPSFAANVYEEFDPRWERADPFPIEPRRPS